MGIDQPIDITAEQRKLILALLEKHLPNTTAWVYGSRAKGTARPQADLDMVVFTKPEQSDQVIELREAFEESDLPFRVDLFVWDALPENFRPQVTAEHVVLLQKEKKRERANGWKNVTLGDYIDVNDATYSRRDAWHQVNYLETGGICENRISEIKKLIFGRDKIPSRARRKVQPGDIVYSTVRPDQRHYGLLKKPPGNLLVSSGFAVIRGKKELACTEFIYWFLSQNHIVEQLQTLAEHSTSAYPSIKPNDIEALKVTLPPLEEQRAIAHILGTLDDKIELNQRMNKTLEAMAQALFKSWFVDFDPVRAKMEGQDTGLPQPVAALFPDRMVNSEIGEIPYGWRVLPLPDLININPSRTLRKGESAPYLPMSHMPTKGHFPDQVTTRSYGSGMRFKNGDTLVARITPCLENGKTAFVDFLLDGEIGWGSTEYIVMHAKQPLPNEFAYCLARSTRFREFAIQNMTGTSGRQRLPAKALAQFPQIAPAKRVAEAFRDLIGPLIALASAAAKESRALSGLRDTLLPKLITGELRTSVRETREVTT